MGLVVSCAESELCKDGACEGWDAAATDDAHTSEPVTEASSRGETTSSRVAESTESSRDGGAPSSGLSGASSGTSGETLSDTSSCAGAACVMERSTGYLNVP